jgi:hypothetical protein
MSINRVSIIDKVLITYITHEYFEPKSPFKSNDLKGLVNFSRGDLGLFELIDRGFPQGLGILQAEQH